MFHCRSKHINIKQHYIRNLVKEKEIVEEFCASADPVANIFTIFLQRAQDKYIFQTKEDAQNDKSSLRENVRFNCNNKTWSLSNKTRLSESLVLSIIPWHYFFYVADFVQQHI